MERRDSPGLSEQRSQTGDLRENTCRENSFAGRGGHVKCCNGKAAPRKRNHANIAFSPVVGTLGGVVCDIGKRAGPSRCCPWRATVFAPGCGAGAATTCAGACARTFRSAPAQDPDAPCAPDSTNHAGAAFAGGKVPEGRGLPCGPIIFGRGPAGAGRHLFRDGGFCGVPRATAAGTRRTPRGRKSSWSLVCGLTLSSPASRRRSASPPILSRPRRGRPGSF